MSILYFINCRSVRLRLFSLCQRHGENKAAALAKLAFHPDASAMPLHNLLYHRQPQPRAYPLFSQFTVQPGKGFEYSFLVLFLDTDAVIDDAHLAPVTLRSCLDIQLASIRGV